MMKMNVLLFLIITVLFGRIGFAEEVSLDKATTVAVNCYYEKAGYWGYDLTYGDITPENRYIVSYQGKTSYVVFSFRPQGFVIVSAEDVLPPVLGYSLSSNYSAEDQPDSYRNFMQGYSDAINYARDNNIVQDKETRELWRHYLSEDPEVFSVADGSKSVEPLLKSLWDQGFPYNAHCPVNPTGPGGHVYAGCVATAMAQVMYYWRYPLQGTGSHSYYYSPYGQISANFGATQYQWEGMLNTITFDQPDPIAELQFHCGVAVEMMYGPNGSGAYSANVPPALKNYFGYSQDCYFTYKDDHSNSQWINLLKGNIDNGWPLYYQGFSSGGGHAFVCDGYNGDLFHFNFGWSGSSNGFYTLANVGGFSSGQGAVFDAYPASGYPYLCSGTKTVTYKKGSITDGSGPIEHYQNNAECSWLIDPQTAEDSVSTITITFIGFDTDIDDVVTIYDGSSPQDNILGEFSGNQVPSPITSTSNKVLIVFTTDGSGTANGWHLQYVANLPEYCKGLTLITASSGTISDGSGDYNYHNNSACMWKIIPEEPEPMTLFFTEFNTEQDKDRVLVFDLETQQLLAEYSGNYPAGSPPPPVTSFSGTFFVAFSANGSVTDSGWKGYYEKGITGTGRGVDNASAVAVFPNPCRDELVVSVPGYFTGKTEISLHALTGNAPLTASFESGQESSCRLDVANLPRGLYLLKITNNEQVTVKRIILQ